MLNLAALLGCQPVADRCRIAFFVAAVTPDDLTGPVNLGNPGEFTIHELASKIVELTESHSEIVFMPLPSDDPRQRKPDITLAREMMGWVPVQTLEHGLIKTIEYFRGVLP